MGTDRMEYEMGCSAKTCLVGGAAEVGGVDTAPHTLVDSYCQRSSDPPAREAEGAEERIDYRHLQVYRTAYNSHRHREHRWGHSAAEGAVDTGRKEKKRSGAEVDTDGSSVAGNDHTDAEVEGDVEGAEEATTMHIAYGMAGVGVDAQGDV